MNTLQKEQQKKRARNLALGIGGVGALGLGIATLGSVGNSGGGGSGGGSSGGGKSNNSGSSASSASQASKNNYPSNTTEKDIKKGKAMLEALYNNRTYDIADKEDYNLMSRNLKNIFPVDDNGTLADYFNKPKPNDIPNQGYTKVLGQNIPNTALNTVIENSQTPYWKKQLELFDLKGSDLRNPKAINYALKYSPQIALATEIQKQVPPLSFPYIEDSSNYKELKHNLKNHKISGELANNATSLGTIISPFTGVYEPISKEATKAYGSFENRVISTEDALNLRKKRNNLLKDPDLKNYLDAKHRISTDKVKYNPNKVEENITTLGKIQSNPKIQEYISLNEQYKEALDKIKKDKKIYQGHLNNVDSLVHSNLGIPNKKPITSLGKIVSMITRAR